MLNKEFVNFNNKLYTVYKKVKQSQVKEEQIQGAKEYWHCDVAVKQKNDNDEIIYFLREVIDAEIVVE